MQPEPERGYAGALRRSRFSMMVKASNHYCLAMFSIIWAMRLMKFEVKKLKGYNVSSASTL